MLYILGNWLRFVLYTVCAFLFIYLIKSKLFNVTCVITYPAGEYHLPFCTLPASHARLPPVFQTCHALPRFVPLPMIFPLPEMPLQLSILLSSAQASLHHAVSPSLNSPSWWSTGAAGIPTSHLSVSSILHSASGITVLKCKPDHISFLLKILSPAASLWLKVEIQHSI